MSKGCDITDFIQNLLNAKNPDGTRKFTDVQIRGKLKAAYRKGLISKAQIVATTGQKELLITDKEWSELEDLYDKAATTTKPLFEALTTEEVKRLVELSDKARNSVGMSTTGRIDQQRLLEVIEAANEVKPTETVKLLDMLDDSIKRAKQNNNQRRVAELRDLKDKLMAMTDLSSRLKIDWNAIAKTNKSIEKLSAEWAAIKSILDIGDRDTAKKRKDLSLKIIDLKIQLVNLSKDTTLSDKEKETKALELQSQVTKLLKELDEITSPKFAKASKRLQKRLKTIQLEIRRLQNNAPNSFFNRVLMTLSGTDPNFYVTSLRELKRRQLKTQDDIKLVNGIIEEHDDDKKYTMGDIQNLFGEDISSSRRIKHFFYEKDLNDDGSEKLDSSNQPLMKKREFISKEEVKQILPYWEEYKRNKTYESSITTVEATAIKNQLLSGDKKLPDEVDPLDPLPVGRTKEEALTTKVGYNYDPRKIEDRVKVVQDLHAALQRLSYVNSLANSRGILSEGMLVGILGTDAQSLLHKFDPAIADDLELDNPYVPSSATTREARLAILRDTLANLGYTNDQINAMPEFSDINYVDNFERVVAIDLEWEKGTNNIVAVSVVEFHGGKPAHSTVIYSKKGDGEIFDASDAQDILSTIERYQNNKFKVVGHNFLGEDSDLQKLVSVSGSTKQGLAIAHRMFDTMLLTFRNSPSGNFSRRFGPSLNNLGMALLGKGKTTTPSGVTGENAFDYLRSGKKKEFEEYILGDSVLTGQILLEMVHRMGSEVEVENRGRGQPVLIKEVVPMWYDTGKPEVGRNQRYTGIESIYDIQSFRNFRESNGHGMHNNMLYEISKVRNVMTNIILAIMKTDKPEEIQAIFNSVNAREKDAVEQIDTLLEISRVNQEAYLPVLRQMREQNKNKFIIHLEDDGLGGISPVLSGNETEYIQNVVDEVLDILKNEKRGSPNKIIARFADTIQFRKIKDGENLASYVQELFEYAASKFNNKPKLKIVDFGNGNFDYVPASQLGRGFAQVMMGHVEDGLTLSQSIKTPVEEIDRRRAEAKENDREIAFEDLDNLVQKREYLPLSRQNVSYFAPLSMYEQERAYDDFALARRYHHILNRDITDDDINRFKQWIQTDTSMFFKQTLRAIRKIKAEINKGNITEDIVLDILDSYIPGSAVSIEIKDAILNDVYKIEDSRKAKEPAVNRQTYTANLRTSLNSLYADIERRYNDYIKQQDFRRLEQGRIQRYSTIYQVNNRDIYTRIPTFEETQEMALEVALDLPSFAAIFVHDSVTLRPEDSVFLDGPAHWDMPEMSSGGPTGAALLSGIHPQLAWLMSHPEVSNDPEMMKNLVLKSFENGRKLFKTRGYSRTTYWDDNMSGLHHILMLLWTYFPDTSVTQEDSALQILNNIKTGNVGKSDLTDYYTKTSEQFLIALEKLKDESIKADGSDPAKNETLAQINKIQTILENPASDMREFFKGSVIPVLYTGGQPAVIQGLRNKREKIESGDPIKNLTEKDIEFIARTLTVTGAVVQGRLIDEILGLDANKIQDLMELFTKETTKLTKDTRKRWVTAFQSDENLQSNFISLDAARIGMDLRIRYIAELTAPPRLLENTLEREQWITERVKQIKDKWQDRITKAEKIIKDAGGRLEVGSQAERNFHVALAGDESAFKNQLTLMAINQMQAAGIKLNTSDRALLEASVMTGRYIAPEDLMYRDHIVYTTVGIGTGSGRAQYVGNYLTNLHGNRLSKATRLVYNEDGTINWKDTVRDSAWGLVGNQFAEMPKAKAIKKIEQESIRTYMLLTATDYPPTTLEYNIDEESRKNFFQAWAKRTKREREWEKGEMLDNVQKLKEAYENDPDSRPALTDEQIEQQIKSSSTPFAKRIRTRILAPSSIGIHDDTIMTTNDAKGLAAFRPRIADNPFEDRIISGLYSIYQNVKKLETGIGSMRRKVQRMEEEGITPESVLDMQNARTSMYDPDALGIYFPEMDSTVVQELFGYDLTFNQKRNQLKFMLDTFAIKNGLEDLVKTKQYARLLQIYKIRQSLKKFTSLVSRGEMSVWEMRFLHRHFVQQVFNITKAQRDATNSSRNILDFSKSIAIDPSKFRNEDGSNMMWIDALGVLADLGIEELGTIEFGMSPVELLTTNTDSSPDVLKGERTSILPNVVQGRDVAIILQGIFANIAVKEQARLIVEDMIAKKTLTSPVEREPNSKYIVISSLPPDIQGTVLTKILNDDDLMFAAVNNLGFHVTMQFVAGKNFLRFQQSKFHMSSQGAYVVPNQGLGSPTVSKTVVGQQDVQFFLTPEAVKRILIGARNSPLLTRVETAVAVNKSLGGVTRVDQLRRERYGEYLDRHLEQIAEETELLDSLEEGNLQRIETDRLKDELGLTLNLYDAEAYFTTEDNITKLTPFKNAITLDFRIAMERAKQYPGLQAEYENLERLFTEEKYAKYLTRLGFIISIKNNLSRDISDHELKVLMDEHFGEILSPDDLDELMTLANKTSIMLDRINHSPFKGKNKYLAAAIKHRQQTMDDPTSFEAMDVDHFIGENSIPAEDHRLAAQAVKEAYYMEMATKDLPETFKDIPSDDLIRLVADPTEFEKVFPEGMHINTQLTDLKVKGVIDDETENFYRLLIAKVLKHNPNLAKYLSISVADMGSARVAEAVKDNDKFIININPNVLKNMGRVDQVRVFAHEISHIARLAFIEDNSKEWRQIEALFRSQKGRTAISAMLMAMNNNQKYFGFEDDLAYYTSNPEEFIAQWGSWVLMNNAFNNTEVMKFLQTRSRAALTVTDAYKASFARIKHEVLKISTALGDIDETILTDILDITENMFGFTASSERQIFIRNENKSLGLISDFDNNLSNVEIDQLAALHNKVKSGGITALTPSEATQYTSLSNKYQAGPAKLLDIVEYRELKKNRETEDKVAFIPSRTHSGIGKKNIDNLSEKELEEMASTALIATLERGGKVARNTGTIGGWTRQKSEEVFGPKLTETLQFGFYYLGTANLTRATSTYFSKNSIAATLMHIIGESLSISQNQFQKETGTRSIRENRLYAQQWVERVAYEVGQLQRIADTDEFNQLMIYAVDLAHGIPVTAPTGISSEKVSKAVEVSKAIFNNSKQMRQLIYGPYQKHYEDVPTGLDRTLIGARRVIDDPKRANEFERNRKLLIDEVAKIIEDNIRNNGAINSTFFYISGLAPRIANNYEVNEAGIADIKFIQELNRVKDTNPGTFDMIAEIAVRTMVIRDNLTESEARLRITRAKADKGFLINGSPKMHKELFDATHKFYAMVDKYKHQTEVLTQISKMGKLKGMGGINSVTIANFENEIQLAVSTTTPITDMGTLFNENTTSFPEGVSNITKRSAMSVTSEKETSLLGILSGMFLSELGDYPDFLRKNGIVTGKQLRENPNTAKFINTRVDTILTDIERAKGFRAISRIAIQDITGIAGIDIYDLIKIFRKLAARFSPNKESGRKEIDEILDVIEQNLQIEQGLQARGLGEEGDAYTNLLLKWGPDITRLAYGPNLNTASLVMEGALGAFISARYGGNPLEFVKDVFGGLFGQFQRATDVFTGNMDRYNPRGLAVNMMRGIEQNVRNGRDIWHHAQDYATDSPTWWDKYKVTMSRVNNAVFESLSESLTNQAQRIIVENLNNGNLIKIRTMLSTETLNNMDELQSAMNKYNIRGILPHMVYELKMAGIFEPEIIEAYTYMLNNVKSKDTKDGTLDFIQANKWIENHKFSAAFMTKNGFTKASAYRAVAAMYNASKNFRNIVTVEHNPWDMDTHKGAMRFLYSFYRQFPNLFFAQKMLRLSNKMDMATFATFLIATTIMDLVYNALLLVALGALPLTALLPFHKDFLFTNNPAKTIQLLVSRNPIFGVTGNILLGSGMKVYESLNNINSYRNAQNEYAAFKKALGGGYDELALDFVPSQAIETLTKDPLTMMYVLFTTGGNLNQQETHDFYNGLINTFSRFIPLVGELPVRIAATKTLMGDRPATPQFGGTVVPQQAEVPPSYKTKKLSDLELQEKARKDNSINKPIQPPSGLLR